MALLGFRTSTYARNIYIFGTTSFDSIPAEYHEAVKQFGATTYTDFQLREARRKLFVSEQEYQETLAYKYPDGLPANYNESSQEES